MIIDEEQRFGVEVKERLKALRQTVDVLTMTATPIPRTLHMSLLGVRDISNLETPPEDRLAVETRVTRFDDELIRHAVLRELNRGGQILLRPQPRQRHRSVGLQAAKHRARRPHPHRGHGQMPEHQLEQVMLDFVAHKFDMLLATTIIESGLDIPNANTIFIDEADRYGLADLHQLRGRVGRYKHRAYCYLLVDPNKYLSTSSAKRLRAIEEFSDMGAGFEIAMRDLEIRGAGNILGTQQSGHIAAGRLRTVLRAAGTSRAPRAEIAAQRIHRSAHRSAGRNVHPAHLRARHAAEDRPLPPAHARTESAEPRRLADRGKSQRLSAAG